MNSDFLSALEGAEQQPSQGFNRSSYPTYSNQAQEIHSSSGPSDDDLEVVSTSQYKYNISGHMGSSPMSTTHKQPQNFSREEAPRIPKKLTPPPNNRMSNIQQSPHHVVSQERQNGIETLLSAATAMQQASPSPPLQQVQQGSSKIYMMVPQGSMRQGNVASPQHRMSPAPSRSQQGMTHYQQQHQHQHQQQQPQMQHQTHVSHTNVQQETVQNRVHQNTVQHHHFGGHEGGFSQKAHGGILQAALEQSGLQQQHQPQQQHQQQQQHQPQQQQHVVSHQHMMPQTHQVKQEPGVTQAMHQNTVALQSHMTNQQQFRGQEVKYEPIHQTQSHGSQNQSHMMAHQQQHIKQEPAVSQTMHQSLVPQNQVPMAHAHHQQHANSPVRHEHGVPQSLPQSQAHMSYQQHAHQQHAQSSAPQTFQSQTIPHSRVVYQMQAGAIQQQQQANQAGTTQVMHMSPQNVASPHMNQKTNINQFTPSAHDIMNSQSNQSPQAVHQQSRVQMPQHHGMMQSNQSGVGLQMGNKGRVPSQGIQQNRARSLSSSSGHQTFEPYVPTAMQGTPPRNTNPQMVAPQAPARATTRGRGSRGGGRGRGQRATKSTRGRGKGLRGNATGVNMNMKTDKYTLDLRGADKLNADQLQTVLNVISKQREQTGSTSQSYQISIPSTIPNQQPQIISVVYKDHQQQQQPSPAKQQQQVTHHHQPATQAIALNTATTTTLGVTMHPQSPNMNLQGVNTSQAASPLQMYYVRPPGARNAAVLSDSDSESPIKANQHILNQSSMGQRSPYQPKKLTLLTPASAGGDPGRVMSTSAATQEPHGLNMTGVSPSASVQMMSLVSSVIGSINPSGATTASGTPLLLTNTNSMSTTGPQAAEQIMLVSKSQPKKRARAKPKPKSQPAKPVQRITTEQALAMFQNVSKSSPQFMKQPVVITNKLSQSLTKLSAEPDTATAQPSATIPAAPAAAGSQNSTSSSQGSVQSLSSQTVSSSQTISSSQMILSSQSSSSASTQEVKTEEKTAAVQQKEVVKEPPPRPKSPEVPPELQDKEGLCRNCGCWSADLKSCEGCGKNLLKFKPSRYRKKSNKLDIYPKPATSSKDTESDSKKVTIVKKLGVSANAFYSDKLGEHLATYKGSGTVARITTRGGGRGSRRGRGRGGGRTYKRPEPELISISSDSEDEEDSNNTPVSNSDTPATPNKGVMLISESQQSNGSSAVESESDVDINKTPPVKRKSKMKDQEGNTPLELAPLTLTPEAPNAPPKKVVRKNPEAEAEAAITSPNAVPIEDPSTDSMMSDQDQDMKGMIVPVVEQMQVCLIRFGSWTPNVIHPVTFQSNCVMFSFNATTDHVARLRLEAKDITLCQYSLKKGMPTIFLYTTPKFAMMVRERLKMTKGSGPYFDPGSSAESEKRVIVRPMSDPDHVHTTKILEAFDGMAQCTNRLKSALFEELEKEAVNRLLVISKPAEHLLASASSELPRPKQRQPSVALCSPTITKPDPKTMKVTHVERASLDSGDGREDEPMEDGDHIALRRILGPCVTLFIYPLPPSTGGITVTSDDLACLDEGEFLNDVIIDFYLKYLLTEKLSEADKKRTHIFSSFFYKRLMQREYGPHVTNPELTAIEKRHNRVKKWTRNVDLFEKDFIVIPINESAHWYVAIICYPGDVSLPEWQSRSSKYEGSEASESPSPQPPNLTSEAEAAPTPAAAEEEQPNNADNTSSATPPELTSTSEATPDNDTDDSAAGNKNEVDKEEPMEVDEPDSATDDQPMETQETTSAIDDSTNSAEPASDSAEPASNSVEPASDSAEPASNSAEPVSNSAEPASNSAETSATAPATNNSVAPEAAASTQKDSASGTWQVQDTPESPKSTDTAESQPSSTVDTSQEASQERGNQQPEPEKTNPKVIVVKKNQQKESRQPCILIFDSLRGPCRRHVIQKLREYLAVEWLTRKKSNCTFDGSTLRGQTPEVPQQTNYSDCGVFVLQYVETFFEKPIKYVSVPLRGLTKWFSEETANGKRGEIASLIDDLKKKWAAEKEGKR